MTTLFLDEFIVDQFQRRVVPVLEARAVSSSLSPAEHLQHLLADRPRLWTVTVQRPRLGDVFAVQFTRQGTPEVYDCRVFVPDLPDECQGPQTVRVDSVYGFTASCTLVNLPAAGRDATAHTLLAISCRELTLLADFLPGQDCFFAVAVWANEVFPLSLLAKRPRQMLSVEANRHTIALLQRDQLGFATTCERCRGAGTLPCDRCAGTGVFKPRIGCDKCGGTGHFSETCRKCGGTGSFTSSCRKCSGTGRYEKGGSCNRCYGTGRINFTCNPCGGRGTFTGGCRPCEGRGFFPQLDCNPCQGKGTIGCFVCKGSRLSFVHFSGRDGKFSRSTRDADQQRTLQVVPPPKVLLARWTDDTIQKIQKGAEGLLREVKERIGNQLAFDARETAALQEHCHRVSRIEQCLLKSIASQGIQETRPVRIHSPQPSLGRGGGVVYEFQVRKSHAAWARDGVLPFPRLSPLNFMTAAEKGGFEPLDLPRQTEHAPAPDERPVLVDCRGKGSQLRFLVRFPCEIDMARLPREVLIQPAAPPPGEITQLRHLRRWCGRDNRDHPVLHSLAIAVPPTAPLPPVRVLDAGIDRQPMQNHAVQMGVSNLPLALIKGPPGTGKTSVITEIVRQMVARGQKVLICSQTHQAVRNVLERLHHIGGFRMVRYGRPDSCTELERRYLPGGMADEFPVAVTQRCREMLRELRENRDRLRDAMPVVTQAREVARQLAEVRGRTAGEIQRLDDERRRDAAEADRVLAEGVSAAVNEEAIQIAPHRAEIHTAQQEWTAAQARRIAAMQAREIAAAAYRNRTGRFPEDGTVTPTFLKSLRDKLLPDMLVSSEALRERFSVQAALVRELQARETEWSQRLAAAQQETAGINRQRLATEERCRTMHQLKREKIDAHHAKQTARVQKEAAAAEQPLRALQREALSRIVSLGLSLTDDSPPAAWAEASQKIATELALADEKGSYVQSWIRDVEADPGSILACWWDSIQVFFSTCVGLSSWRPLVERGRDAVDLVIVDEAAHATITETLVPLLYAPRALLIGDEMQLPPILVHDVRCEPECEPPVLPLPADSVTNSTDIASAVRMADCPLECSLFEWLWRAKPQVPRVMLDVQFRMHSAIADFVGAVFYPEGLRTGVANADRHLAFGEFTRPVCLVSTSAYPGHHEEFLDPGYRNALEARLVSRVIAKAESELAGEFSFGVITPYAHQVSAIVDVLEGQLLGLQRARLNQDDIASVDSFQGSERDVIVISFVRSPAPCPRCQGKGQMASDGPCSDCRGRGWRGTELTFVRDLRRLNVAFSRARRMLILIGDLDALTDSRYRGGAPGGRVLAQFQDYVHDRGKVLHVWEGGHDGSR